MSSGRDAGEVVSGPCTTGADCRGGVCDRAAGRCVACRTTDECVAGQVCQSGACIPGTGCQSDLECTPAGLVCDAAGGRCVACNSAAECGDLPCLGHSCVTSRACQSSLDCADLMMVCADARTPAWPDSYGGQGCAECASAADCASGEACRGGLCKNVCAGEGRICGSVDGAECGTCAGSGLCLPDGKGCVEGLAGQIREVDTVVQLGSTLLLAADGRNSGVGTVWSVDLAGTGEARVLFRAEENVYIDGLAVSQGLVYAALTSGVVVSGPMQGTLTPWQNVPGVGPSDSVWCQGLAGHNSLVICALVDYDEAVPSGLYLMPVDGQPAQMFASIVQPDGLFVAGDEVFWADFNGARVGKSSVANGQTTVLASVQANLRGLAGGYAFYETTDGTTYRVAQAGGSPESVMTRPRRFAGATDDRLYAAEIEDDLAVFEMDLAGQGAREIFRVPQGLAGPSEALLEIVSYGDDLYLIGRYGIARVRR